MWKTIIGKFGEKVVYGFGLGMGLSFKILSVKNINKKEK